MMPPKLGIIAGGGMLPIRLAEHCLASARPVFAVLLAGQARAEDFTAVPHATYRLGAAGGAIKRLRAEGAEVLVFAGHVRKPTLAEVRPDLWSARFLVRTGVFGAGDDNFLHTLIRALEGEGFRVVGADDVAPELLAPAGCLTARAPDASNTRDIEIGISAARALGARDAGQAVVAAGGRTVAEEDSRGTDAMLAGLAGGSAAGGVLIKVLKPGQERRADLPTIGPETVASAKAAGLAGIAVSAGDALILERDACLAAADASGIFIVGVSLDSDTGQEAQP
jgi:DUF1009 family protein